VSLVILSTLLPHSGAHGQQVPDSAFHPPVTDAAFSGGNGPLVLIDEAHHNFHTSGGRYFTFAELLRRDGCRVMPLTTAFTVEALDGADILVISNALHERNASPGTWSLPTPSAFSNREIRVVVDWVRDGGSLLLIADHMPFPGAAEQLAAEFGFHLNNGFAVDTTSPPGDPYVFRRVDGTLVDHPITRGRREAERIDSVVTFTGEAFQGEPHPALLRFGPGVVSIMPDTAWQFEDDTRTVDVTGWLQGAVSFFGEGRVAVFGEAAMFSAQLAGPNRLPMGMNHPRAPQNAQFLLNVVHWLSGIL
jgi:hypothetical protein